MNAAAWAYLVLGLLVAGVAWRRRLDPDIGGYPDRFRDVQGRLQRDKVQHFGGSAVLAFVSGLLMALGTAAAITWALGWAWELQQRFPYDRRRRGYWSWLDIVADGAGVVVGIGAAWLVRRLTGWTP